MPSYREEELSEILLNLLSELGKNPPPDPYSSRFHDWEIEMKIHTDDAACNILKSLDHQYKE